MPSTKFSTKKSTVDADKMLRLIGTCAAEVLPELAEHDFRRCDRLGDLGADSVDRAEIVSLVLESLSLKISRTALSGPENVGELADRLCEKLAGA
jgi:polyketide biosynthesis acyl carrier protein